MSINVPLIGNAKLIALDLTTTDPTTIYTAPASALRGLMNSMLICNDSGGAATFTLTLTDPSANVFKLYNLKSVASNDTFPISEHEIPVPSGWTMAITATSANTLHVVAVIIELAVTK
jgi:hypothetical protein